MSQSSGGEGCGCLLLLIAGIGLLFWFKPDALSAISGGGTKVEVAIVEKRSPFSGEWDRVAVVYGFESDKLGAQLIVDLANGGDIGEFRVVQEWVSERKLKAIEALDFTP